MATIPDAVNLSSGQVRDDVYMIMKQRWFIPENVEVSCTALGGKVSSLARKQVRI